MVCMMTYGLLDGEYGNPCCFSYHFVYYFMWKLRTGLQTDTDQESIHIHMQISQQALHTSTAFLPKLHLYPSFPTRIPLHHFALICLPHITKSLFIGIYRGFYLFSYKKNWEYFLFVMFPIYGRELAQFPISLLFFPDSHISMSLLGLSVPSLWI